MEEFNEVLGGLGENDLILDVREPGEFSEHRIAGSTNVPLGTVGDQADRLKTYHKVYVLCRRGRRAQSAVSTVEGKGLQNLVCISDWGTEAWVNAGFPYEHD